MHPPETGDSMETYGVRRLSKRTSHAGLAFFGSRPQTVRVLERVFLRLIYLCLMFLLVVGLAGSSPLIARLMVPLKRRQLCF